MAVNTMVCVNSGCGVIITARDAIDGKYCSIRCQVLSQFVEMAKEHGLASEEQIEALPAIPEPATQNKPMPVPDAKTIGENWRLTGERFEGLAKKTLEKEEKKTGERIIIIAGNGANLKVERDCLVITYGITHTTTELNREEICRGVHNVSRILWANATGNISSNALGWMNQQKINFLMLDKDGNRVCESFPMERADIALRRKQYNMSEQKQIEIARWLILTKIQNQEKTYRQHPCLKSERADNAFPVGTSWLSLNPLPEWLQSVKSITLMEGRCARAYFVGWKTVPLKWFAGRNHNVSRNPEIVPEHWKTFGDRLSPLGKGSESRHAVTPGQAILNYCYGVLEHVARTALLAYGFDTNCGIVHYDLRDRESLIHDLIELGRGSVDAKVLRFVENTTFHTSDFVLVKSGDYAGEIRLHPQLARAVVAACSPDMDLLMSYAKQLKEMVMSD